jgi:hypothetical protein
MRFLVFVVALVGCVTSCGGDPTGPQGLVRFADRDINLGQGVSGQFQLTNVSSDPLSGVTFKSRGAVKSGVAVEGARLTVLSGSLGVLEPGRKLSFPFTLEIGTLSPGSYTLELSVLVDGEESDRAKIRFIKGERRR